MTVTGMHSPVVVAVDGTEQDDATLGFAAQEAQRHGSGIRVVHAFHETIPMAPMMPPFGRYPLMEAAQSVADDAVRQLRELVGDEVPIETEVQPVPVARAILHTAHDARAIVVGRRPLARMHRMVAGSTSMSLAAKAACPVFSVPFDWSPDVDHGRVVVGIDDTPASSEVLAMAFDAAALRHDTLVVVHAWHPPNYYADVVELREILLEWEVNAEVTVSKALAGWREKYPDVPVEISVRRQRPADALTDASEQADLLVVGRRGSGGVAGLLVGSVARAALGGAHCPVALAPHPD